MESIVFVGALALLIFLLVGREYVNGRKARARLLERLYAGYGQPPDREYQADEMAHIAMYYRKHPCDGQIDDITWNDLHLDGLYRQINVSCSASGDEYLYYRLRTPIYDREEAQEQETLIRYFAEHEEERRHLQSALTDLGRMGKHSLYEYLDYLDGLGERGNGRYYVSNLLLLACVGVMFLSVPLGLVLLLGMLCHNIVGYYKEYAEIEPYIASFRYIDRLLAGAAKIGGIPAEGIARERERLLMYHRSMRAFRRNTWLVVYTDKGNGNPLGILLDYLRMLFYLDLMQFNRALRAVRGHREQIDGMITEIGRIELAIGIGSYRQSLRAGYCVPVIHYEKDAANRLDIDGLYHPLLEHPVKNSVLARRGVLVTGSNASGKSTFLRAAAVCAVLAQTVQTCPANRYEAPALHIYSSMSLQDNLLGGQSYYMVEIKSVRRILDHVKEAAGRREHVLCFVDEVLRGTNTVERIAASVQILRALCTDNTLCFAATHDVELTKLLAAWYDNYHFEERIEQKDIFFPYRLMPGPAVSRNAIALLRLLEYDDGITERAERMAQRFLADGRWDGAAFEE